MKQAEAGSAGQFSSLSLRVFVVRIPALAYPPLMRTIHCALSALVIAFAFAPPARAAEDPIRVALEAARPLSRPRGARLPLYVWHLNDFSGRSDAETRALLGELDARGLAAFSRWTPGAGDSALAEPLRVAAIQEELGLDVNAETTACLSSFFDGSEATAHVDDAGKPFFDASFGSMPMGCPFALEHRVPEIRGRIERFAEAYRAAGRRLDFVFADWEIDGPIEWNGAWDSSKRCRRCRERIPNLDSFSEFQLALRAVRSDLQRRAFAEPILARYPKARVGNYAVYPHRGVRFWYDYFEKLPECAPFIPEAGARHRLWAHEFAGTGYTCAMPVVYTWHPIYEQFGSANGDRRWMRGLLETASEIPPTNRFTFVSFVHWHTTAPPEPPAAPAPRLSESAWREVLWHLLLRGHDAFFLWCLPPELAAELAPLHEVYAASLEYSDFILAGEPLLFDVAGEGAPFVSALRLGNRVLLRRTDLEAPATPAEIDIGGRAISVPSRPGENQVIGLPPEADSNH